MVFDYTQVRPSIILFLFFIFIQTGKSQTVLSEEAHYQAYDEYIGLENSEINNGPSFRQQYRTLDRSHMFFETPEFLEGHVIYKNQPYDAKLKYDIMNDLVVVKYKDNTKSFPVGLNASLVDKFKIADRAFVRLEAHEELDFLYKNGFFEEAFIGENFEFYVKHIKKLKKNTSRSQVYYFFIEEKIYIFKYDNYFYEIRKKRDIAKVVPHYKKDINNFFGHLRTVNTLSLTRLFAKIDKMHIDENE